MVKAKSALPTGRTEWQWWIDHYQTVCAERGLAVDQERAAWFYRRGYSPHAAATEEATGLDRGSHAPQA